MATLSSADKQNLNADQQAAVLKAKQDWETANAAGDQAGMDAAHKAAEAVRASSANGAYSGGSSGNSYSSQSNGGGNPYMKSSTGNGNSSLSAADNAMLNADQQQQIANLKAAWAQANAAGDQAGMTAAHKAAEEIRASAGYTAGSSGTGYSVLGATAGGMTADQMRQWLEDYQATNYQAGTGWTNGYSTAMNTRSKANKIRQQMQANEQAQQGADAATQQYLHEQNLALAQLLYQYTGQSEANTYYNDQTGRWETWNSDVGYGYNVQGNQDNIRNSWKQYLGYTDDDIEKYANDTSLYYNFVDPRTVRLATDESSGFTGIYSQFRNGPYAQLLGGGTHDGSVNPSIYQNMPNDGWEDESVTEFTPIRDENGNVINTTAPKLKNNNAMSDYTNQFTSYTQGGVIQPGILAATSPGASGDSNGAYSHKVNGNAYTSDPRYAGGIDRDVAASTADDPNNAKGQLEYARNYGSGSSSGSSNSSILSALSGSGGSDYSSYIEQMYAAALESQLAQLESSYKQNISDLDSSIGTVNDTYTEQKRQTTGTSAQQAAAWREMANAYGLNSGAVGQAALAQNNQLQSNLNTLESAQSAALTEIEQQRTLLGQQYQLQINQAIAENDYNKAQALYQEAVRQDELLLEKQQLAIQTALQVAQMAMNQSQFNAEMDLSYAQLYGTGSGSSSSSGSGSNYSSDQTIGTTYSLDDMFDAAYTSGVGAAALSSKSFRDQYGYSDYNGDDLQKQYNIWLGTQSGSAASNYWNIVNSSPTMSRDQKVSLAENYYSNGYINYNQLEQILNSLGA